MQNGVVPKCGIDVACEVPLCFGRFRLLRMPCSRARCLTF